MLEFVVSLFAINFNRPHVQNPQKLHDLFLGAVFLEFFIAYFEYFYDKYESLHVKAFDL